MRFPSLIWSTSSCNSGRLSKEQSSPRRSRKGASSNSHRRNQPVNLHSRHKHNPRKSPRFHQGSKEMSMASLERGIKIHAEQAQHFGVFDPVIGFEQKAGSQGLIDIVKKKGEVVVEEISVQERTRRKKRVTMDSIFSYPMEGGYFPVGMHLGKAYAVHEDHVWRSVYYG